MLDHIGLAVTDLASSRAFYETALAPLGITVLQVIDENEAGGTAVMMGDSEPFFVFADNEQPGEGTHIAFRASSRAQVDGFYAAAMAAGGRTMARLVSGRTIIRIITRRSCLIPTGSMSRRSAICPGEADGLRDPSWSAIPPR